MRRLAGPVDVAEGARLPDPLAPDRAALVAGVELPRLHDQLGLILGAAAGRDDVLVEGAGGVTVNLGRTFGLLDLAGQVRQAGQPVAWIVVARAGLGTLNHSKLTVGAIRDRGFAVQGIVIGSWPAEPGLAERHNRDDDLASHTGGTRPARRSRRRRRPSATGLPGSGRRLDQARVPGDQGAMTP